MSPVRFILFIPLNLQFKKSCRVSSDSIKGILIFADACALLQSLWFLIQLMFALFPITRAFSLRVDAINDVTVSLRLTIA